MATCLFVFLRMLNDLLTLAVSPLTDSDKGIYMNRSKAYIHTNAFQLYAILEKITPKTRLRMTYFL